MVVAPTFMFDDLATALLARLFLTEGHRQRAHGNHAAAADQRDKQFRRCCASQNPFLVPLTFLALVLAATTMGDR